MKIAQILANYIDVTVSLRHTVTHWILSYFGHILRCLWTELDDLYGFAT